MDTLYGALTTYDGKPTDYQLTRIDTLGRELDDVAQAFKKLEDGEVAAANASLRANKLPEIAVPAAAPQESASTHVENEEAHAPWERD